MTEEITPLSEKIFGEDKYCEIEVVSVKNVKLAVQQLKEEAKDCIYADNFIKSIDKIFGDLAK